MEPSNDSESGGCAVSLDTPDTYKEVIVYYRMQLGSHGWTVRDLEVTYQPAGHYWSLQWLELASFLGAAVILAGFCFWWVRRRRV